MQTDAEMRAYRERERRELTLIVEERAERTAAVPIQHRCKFVEENHRDFTNYAEGAHLLLFEMAKPQLGSERHKPDRIAEERAERDAAASAAHHCASVLPSPGYSPSLWWPCSYLQLP